MSLLVCLILLVSELYAQIPNCYGGNDTISSLSGYEVGGSNPIIKQYSGYIQVNKTANGSLFYWLIKSIESPDSTTTPFLIWLNGGPGASSLTGMLSENGPFRIIPNTGGKNLSFNNYTWARQYHMVFVDNPIDTGFSFCNAGQQVTNMSQMAQNFLTFMDEFYVCHPELKSNPLYITGESYAGKYIPFIWDAFSHSTKYVVKGLAIGNGIYDPFIQFYTSPYYAYINGIIDYYQFERVNESVAKCMNDAKNASEQIPMNITMLNDSANVCLDLVNGVYENEGGNIFQYDIRVNDASAFNSITQDIASYLRQPQVAKDLHTEYNGVAIPWKSSDGTSSYNPVAAALNYDIVLNNSASIIPRALAAGTRILFYNGQFDGSVCNNYGNQQCLAQLNYKSEWNTLQRTPYFINNLTVGYIKESSDPNKMLSYFVIADSGHLVPYNQPESIFYLITKWIDETKTIH